MHFRAADWQGGAKVTLSHIKLHDCRATAFGGGLNVIMRSLYKTNTIIPCHASVLVAPVVERSLPTVSAGLIVF